ncbi:hypothetical protein ACWDN9_35855, partial [Streptomyces nigra]
MTDQPYQGYDGYDGYDPYRQQPAPQGWPQQQPYDDPQAAQPYTQQWQGQTWETQVQPPVAPPAEETAYMPSQGAGAAYGGYQEPGWGGTQAPAHAQTPAPAQAPPTDGYGPATVAGNARITDAQRARLEGRSPIIEPGVQPAGLTALLGLLLAGAAAIGPYALVVPLVALQAVTAAGWFRLNGMWPARQGIALAFAGALTADVALLASGRTPAAILGTLGV